MKREGEGEKITAEFFRSRVLCGPNPMSDVLHNFITSVRILIEVYSEELEELPENYPLNLHKTAMETEEFRLLFVGITRDKTILFIPKNLEIFYGNSGIFSIDKLAIISENLDKRYFESFKKTPQNLIHVSVSSRF